jgi:hypothetical protein
VLFTNCLQVQLDKRHRHRFEAGVHMKTGRSDAIYD